MKTTLRVVPHSILPAQNVVEIWHDDQFLGTISGADGPGIRVISKHEMETATDRGEPECITVSITPSKTLMEKLLLCLLITCLATLACLAGDSIERDSNGKIIATKSDGVTRDPAGRIVESKSTQTNGDGSKTTVTRDENGKQTSSKSSK